MKKIKIMLVLLISLMIMTSLPVNASSVGISISLPTWANWKDASTKTKNSVDEQTVDYTYTQWGRNICTKLTVNGQYTSYVSSCGDAGDTITFSSASHTTGGTYTLEAKTQTTWFSKTNATMIWQYD